MNKELVKHVPELRFPEFEGDWKKYKLGDISEISSGGTPKRTSKEYWNGEIPWVTTSEIGQRWISESNEKITKLGLDNSSAKIFEPNTILMAMYGQGKTRGQVSQLKIAASTNQACAAIKLNSNIFPDFIFFALFKEYTKLRDLSNDGSQKNLSAGLLKGYRIAKPEKNEQQKIANFLTAIDQRITFLKQKKAALEQYKKGLMQKIFSQEIRFVDDEGNDYPDWEEKRLGEVAKFSKGKGLSKADISEDGINKCIRYGELYTRYSEVIDKVCSNTNLEIEKTIISKKNDVIIPSSGESQIDIATASCVINEGIILGGDLNIIRSEINGVFLAYYLNNYKKHDIASLSQGISVVHLYSTHLSQLKLEIPSKEEQQKIADCLSAIDQSINQLNNQIDQSTQFKKGLLQRMFV